MSRYVWGVVILNITYCASTNLSLDHKHTPCTQVGFCKCEFPNGMGIDLTLLRGSEFNVSVGKDAVLRFYPCKNYNVPNITNTTVLNECERGVSLCLEQHEGNHTKFFNIGLLEESSYDWKSIAQDPYLVFKHSNRTTTIQLLCTDQLHEGLHYIAGAYSLSLGSENACVTTVEAEGRSVLSTFFIIVLVLFLFYFVAGFLVLRFIRGARGWEAIPHAEFWNYTWASFIKMCRYFANGCQHPETYDSI